MKCLPLESLKVITTIEVRKRDADRGVESKSEGNAGLYLGGPALHREWTKRSFPLADFFK